MTLEAQVQAIRCAAALTELSHVRALRLSGTDAFDALDWLCPKELFIRDGQVLQALLLHRDGTPFADIYVGCDDEDFVLLAEGPSRGELSDYLGEHIPGDLDVTVEDLEAAYDQFSLDGPYAWEVLAERFGQDVIGLPYLTLFETDYGLCARVGKTGEFGYHLFVPRAESEAFRGSMHEVGARFDLVEGSRDALDRCALENWFFNIRAEGRHGLTPLELQLQWRISPQKRFLGAEAVEARRLTQTRRVTTVRCPEAIATGDAVLLGDRQVGTLVNAGFSFCRREYLGLALLDLALAHPGLDCLVVARDDARAPIRTASPPLLNNRSLHVDPQQHCYEYRYDFEFPPIA